LYQPPANTLLPVALAKEVIFAINSSIEFSLISFLSNIISVAFNGATETPVSSASGFNISTVNPSGFSLITLIKF
jgi:hypothetical protein